MHLSATSSPMLPILSVSQESQLDRIMLFVKFKAFFSKCGYSSLGIMLQGANTISRFEPADVLCSLGMAINVYLAIFHQYDSASLRHLTGRYLILCYGLPFIPAFALLFISSDHRGRVYGNATVSCSSSFIIMQY